MFYRVVNLNSSVKIFLATASVNLLIDVAISVRELRNVDAGVTNLVRFSRVTNYTNMKFINCAN